MKPDEFYSDIGRRTDAWRHRAHEPGFAPTGELIKAAVPFLARGGRVLDIGCQGGHQLELVAGLYTEAYGLDIAPYEDMWALFPDITFQRHDVDAGPLPFADGWFSSVIATNVLEHVFDVVGLVAEIARVLEPGGTVLISVPNISSWRHLVSIARGRVPRTGADEYPFDLSRGWDVQHLHYFTHQELEWLLNEQGLEIVQTLVLGRGVRVKRLAPRYLCEAIEIVFRKPASSR